MRIRSPWRRFALGLVGLVLDLVFARITRLQCVESAAIRGPEES